VLPKPPQLNLSETYTGGGDAGRFVACLHAGLDGLAVFGLKRRGGGLDTVAAVPGIVPDGLDTVAGRDVYVTACTFKGKKKLASEAVAAPGLWLDLDPPKDRPVDLIEWRSDALLAVTSCTPSPTLIVDSGRGLWGFWLASLPVALDAENGRLVRAGNAALAARFARFGADSVGDLARLVRLPGTTNTKTGRVARLLLADGPRYRLADLLAALDADRYVEREPVAVALPVAPAPDGKRARGRPRSPVNARKYQRLPERWRSLIERGAFAGGKRYASRSEQDMAVVGELVRRRWSDAEVVGVFRREGWLAGERYRSLFRDEGQRRADEYLSRTIQTARRNAQAWKQRQGQACAR
jgi:hypothetical protein